MVFGKNLFRQDYQVHVAVFERARPQWQDLQRDSRRLPLNFRQRAGHDHDGDVIRHDNAESTLG